MTFDLYLILHHSEWKSAQKSIPYIQKNIKARRIVIVSSREMLAENLCGCDFLDENEVFSGLSFSAVKDFIASLGADTRNTGWYLQQFVKLGIAEKCADEYYLVWDADTIPLNPIEFFSADGKPYFNLKREYFSVYFRTIKKLFGFSKKTHESFISEHMLFRTDFVKEMLKKIEQINEGGGRASGKKSSLPRICCIKTWSKKTNDFSPSLKLTAHSSTTRTQDFTRIAA